MTSRTANEIFHIHKLIRESVLVQLIQPCFDDQDDLKLLLDNAEFKDLSGAISMRIEMKMESYIRSLNNTHRLSLTEQEISAWAELYAVLIAPYDRYMRSLHLACICLYEISYENLRIFLNYWSSVQHRMLQAERSEAERMVGRKIDVYALTCSSPISKEMKEVLVQSVLNKLERTKDKSSYSLAPDSLIFLPKNTFHPYDFPNELIRSIASLLATKHLSPRIPMVDQSESYSLPVMVLACRSGIGINSIDDIKQLDLDSIDFPVNRYRYACLLVFVGLLDLLGRKKIDAGNSQTNPFESFCHDVYIGFMDDLLNLCAYAFDYQWAKDEGRNMFNYTCINLLEDDKQNTLLRMAVNAIETFYTANEDQTTANPVISPVLNDNLIREFTLTTIRKLARLLGVLNVDENNVFDKAFTIYHEKKTDLIFL